VIIGPQASGKSLIAQSLYFFRGLEAHLAKRFSLAWLEENNWEKNQIKRLLDDLRKVAFGYFANGTASMVHEDNHNWEIRVYESNRLVKVSEDLINYLRVLSKEWRISGQALSLSQAASHIFIPTERSMFTRYADRSPAVIFDKDIQPYPFWEFANFLSRAKTRYPSIFEKWRKDPESSRGHFGFIMDCQLRALRGAAYLPTKGSKLWKWRVEVEANSPDAYDETKRKIIPIEACASGQTEAWPFFVVASTYGAHARKPLRIKNSPSYPLKFTTNFYFEEPETHLHPAAQIEVVKTIGYLVNLGHSFVVTTHSPFILYVLNNMIMRYMATKEKFREGNVGLNPDDMAVYRIVDGKCQDIMDREDTKLISETELDDVANQLGAEFDQLMDQIYHD
jgi:hypothetical protein